MNRLATPALIALLLAGSAFGQQITGGSSGGSTTFANPTASVTASAVNGSATTAMRSDAAPAIGANAVTNALLANSPQNSIKGAATSTSEVDLTVPSCSGAQSALIWTSGTGPGCNTFTSATMSIPVSPANGGTGVANGTNLTWNAAQTLSFTSGQTMTFPAASDTLDGLGTAQTFTAAKTFGGAGGQLLFGGTTLSLPSFTTNGAFMGGTGGVTVTDNSGVGTITTEAAFAVPAATVARTTSGTITNLVGFYFPAPIAGTGTTATSLWTAWFAGQANFANGLIVNGSGTTMKAGATIIGAANINASNNYATNIGTGTTTSAVSIGGGANVVAIQGLASAGSVPTGSGTCSINTQVGGNQAGSFKANGACAAGTIILTFAVTQATGYVCDAHDMTTPADAINQTAYTTTSATFTGTMANADQATFRCTGF